MTGVEDIHLLKEEIHNPQCKAGYFLWVDLNRDLEHTTLVRKTTRMHVACHGVHPSYFSYTASSLSISTLVSCRLARKGVHANNDDIIEEWWILFDFGYSAT